MAKINRSLAIVIGIDKYEDIPKLKNAVSDAAKLASVLKDIYGYEVLLLKDEEATKAELDQLVTNLKKKTIQFDSQSYQVKPSDRVLFYFAGHGFAEEAQDREDGKPVGYFMPQNAESDNPNTWLSMHEIYAALTDLGCHHLLMILDCCFAGRISWAEYGRNAARSRKLYKQSYEHFIKHPTQQIITSTAYDEKAQDSFRFGQRGDCDGHSPFAHLLLKVLQGNSDGGNDKFIEAILEDKVITVHELFTYIQNQLRQVAHGQTPALSQPRKYDQETGRYVYFKGEYLFPLHNFKPDVDLIALKLDESKNPYKGLASFENKEEDIKLFFGRKRLIEESPEGLLSKVSNHLLTIVLGTSGSGKSSLVKAGLIPALKSAEESGHRKWVICEPMRPGESPLNALNKILLEFESVTSFKSSFNSQEKSNIIFNNIPKLINNNLETKLLLIIDQAEELFTLCKNQEERTEFINLLNVLLINNKQQWRIVITLRSDFEPQLRDAIQETDWQNLWQDGRFFVTPMYREELQQAIEEPVAQRALFFESPKLVNDLIDEVIQMPGGLPLLSFALSELYLKYLKAEENGDRNDRTITEADYKEIGGVTRSLTQTADKTYNKLVEEQVDEQTKKAYESTIRHVMLRMVAISGGELARRRVPKSELDYPGAKKEQAEKVISYFQEARLLVSGNDVHNKPYIEPAHDALVNGWSKLQEWIGIEQEKENLLLQRRLVASARDWSSQGCNQDSPSLWNQDIARLEQLKEIVTSDNCWLNELELRFFEASMKLRDRQEQERLDASLEVGITSSQLLFASNNRLDALLILTKIGTTWQQELEKYEASRLRFLVMLGYIFSELAEYNCINAHEDDEVTSVSWNPVNQIIASASSKGEIKLWNPNGSFIEEINVHNGEIWDLTFSPDGKTLASAGEDGSINLWWKETIASSLWAHISLTEHIARVNSISFSPDSKLIVSGSDDGTIKIWKLKEENSIQTLDAHKASVTYITFSPDGKMLASTDIKGNVKLWVCDTDNIKFFKNINNAHSQIIKSVDFSNDSKILASSGHDRLIKLWNNNGEPIDCFNAQESKVLHISFSYDSNMLASFDVDGVIKLWVKTNNKWSEQGRLFKKFVHEKDIEAKTESQKLIFSKNSNKIISCNGNKTIKFWNSLGKFDGYTDGYFHGHCDFISSINFNITDKTIATASLDGTVKLWSFDGILLNTLTNNHGSYKEVKFSHDGKIVAALNINGQNYKHTVIFWGNDGSSTYEEIYSYGENVNSISFSPIANICAIAQYESIAILNLDNRQVKILNEPCKQVIKVNFNFNGTMLIYSSEDGTVKLWQLDKSKSSIIFDNPNIEVDYIGFINDKTIIEANKVKYSKRSISKVQIRSLDGEIIKSFESKTRNFILDLKVSQDHKIIVSIAQDSIIEFWNLDNDSVRIIQLGNSKYSTASFNPDWSNIAVSTFEKGYQNRIKLWNMNLKKILEESIFYIQDYQSFSNFINI